MSLINVRRSRKKAGYDAKPPRSPRLLVFLLILVVIAAFYVPQAVESFFR
jgi:hypothetical protein